MMTAPKRSDGQLFAKNSPIGRSAGRSARFAAANARSGAVGRSISFMGAAREPRGGRASFPALAHGAAVRFPVGIRLRLLQSDDGSIGLGEPQLAGAAHDLADARGVDVLLGEGG